MGYFWEVTENNGGVIILWVWENGNLVYSHGGYEATGDPDQLLTDIACLESDCKLEGCPPLEDWDGNDLYDYDVIRALRGEDDDKIWDDNDDLIPLTEDEYYDDSSTTKIIASSNGIIPVAEMGYAGSLIFGNGDEEE